MIAELNCQRFERANAIIRLREHNKLPKGILGIEYVDVVEGHKQIAVFFFSDEIPSWISGSHFLLVNLDTNEEQQITAVKGDHLKQLKNTISIPPYDERPEFLVLGLESDGQFDHGHYRLLIKQPLPKLKPQPKLDPITKSFEFVIGPSTHSSFSDSCSSARVQKPDKVGVSDSTATASDPDIPYVAKDYDSFRRLLLNRLSTIMPQWQEPTVADIGVVMVELMAAIGDKLSYYQDAVATEAYLGTARQRKSVRRHLRLMDQKIHEGAAARGFVFVEARNDIKIPVDQFHFLTEINSDRPTNELPYRLSSSQLSTRDMESVERFEPVDFAEPVSPAVDEIDFRRDYNELHFYTWDAKQCSLKRGATSASLWLGKAVANTADACPTRQQIQQQKQRAPRQSAVVHPKPKDFLKVGDFLLIEEVKGPNTEKPNDADPEKKQVVRLTKIDDTTDPVHGHTVWNIEWDSEDELQFDFCISNQLGPNDDNQDLSCKYVEEISVARGNIVAIEHRTTYQNENLGEVPESKWLQQECDTEYELGELVEVVPEFTARLGFEPEQHRNLGHSKPISNSISATSFQIADANDALPAIVLTAPPCVIGIDQQVKRTELRHLKSADALLKFLATDIDWNLRREFQRLLPLEIALKIGSRQRCEAIIAKLAKNREQPPCGTPVVKTNEQNEATYLRDHIFNLVIAETRWLPVDSLLSSGTNDQHFVVEMDDFRRAEIRFGDGTNGARPQQVTRFYATFRTSNLANGNIGPNLIRHIVTSYPIEVFSLRNPLPIAGAQLPEDTTEIQQSGPSSRAERQSAVIAKDYREIVLREFKSQIQNASAHIEKLPTFRLVTVVVDPFAEFDGDNFEKLKGDVITRLDRYRQIGHVVVVKRGTIVPVDLSIEVVIKKGVSPGDVRETVELLLSAQELPNGELGFFHADRLTFGDGIYGSRITEQVNKIAGVANCAIKLLRKSAEHGASSNSLEFRPLEIATVGEICVEIGELA